MHKNKNKFEYRTLYGISCAYLSKGGRGDSTALFKNIEPCKYPKVECKFQITRIISSF